MTVPDPSSLPSVTIRLDGNGVPLPFLQLGGEPDDASSARKSLLAFTADVSALARAVGAAVTDRTDARAYQVYQVGKAFHALAQKILGLFDGLQLLVDYHLIFRMVAGLETSGIVGYQARKTAMEGIQRRVKPDRSIQAPQDWEAALDSLARARENVVELCLLLKEAEEVLLPVIPEITVPYGKVLMEGSSKYRYRYVAATVSRLRPVMEALEDHLRLPTRVIDSLLFEAAAHRAFKDPDKHYAAPDNALCAAWGRLDELLTRPAPEGSVQEKMLGILNARGIGSRRGRNRVASLQNARELVAFDVARVHPAFESGDSQIAREHYNKLLYDTSEFVLLLEEAEVLLKGRGFAQAHNALVAVLNAVNAYDRRIIEHYSQGHSRAFATQLVPARPIHAPGQPTRDFHRHVNYAASDGGDDYCNSDAEEDLVHPYPARH